MNLQGAPMFTNSDVRTQYDTDWNDIAPRFGLAYRITNSFVARGGYGIFYLPSGVGAAGTGAGGFLGFQQTTPWLSTDPRVSQSPYPLATLSNFAPLGIIPPPSRDQLNSSYNIGSDLTGPIRSWGTPPYEQTWNFGLEHELPWSSVIEADYIGKRGTHLYFGGAGNLNILPQGVAEQS